MAGKRRRRNSRFMCVAWAAILCALCLLHWALKSTRVSNTVPGLGTATADDRGQGVLVRPAAIRRPVRVIYPYSVIRGGAYTVAELDAALRADSVAAAHYAVFDRTKMRIIQAPASAAVYVSYRQGDRVYWTRRKVHLKAEEELLTDGVHAARARCGNRISLTAQQPVRSGEPDVDLDIAEPAPVADARPPGDSSLPLVVYETFPPLLGKWLDGGGVPGGAAGGNPGPAGGGGWFGGGAPGINPPPGPTDGLLLPGYTLPPPAQFTLPPATVVPGPIDFATMPPPAGGPGLPWSPTGPLPGGYPGGVTQGATSGGLTLGPPAGWTGPVLSTAGGPPSIIGVVVAGGATGIIGIPPSSSSTVPGSSLPETTGGPAVEVQSPLNAPSAPDGEAPEPATAAMLLCGAAILICLRLSIARLVP